LPWYALTRLGNWDLLDLNQEIKGAANAFDFFLLRQIYLCSPYGM
jgi:hypothetical protein